MSALQSNTMSVAIRRTWVTTLIAISIQRNHKRLKHAIQGTD